MATGNPASGHTKANTTDTVDGLRDGDHILSPSFTNVYEGVHGNGILLTSDGDYDDTNRNDPEALPGAVAKVVASPATDISVTAGYAVVDGVLYNFASGLGNITIANGSIHDNTPGGSVALTSGQEVLYVVYVYSEGGGAGTAHIAYEQGTPVTVSPTTYPDNPNTFLSEPDAALSNKQHTVLCSVRAEFNGSGGADKINILEVNDKRCFIRPTPWHLPTIKSFNSGAGGIRVDSAADLAAVFDGGTQKGAIDSASTPFGAIWQSVDPNSQDGLYYSALDGGVRHTWFLGPNRENVITTSADITFTFDEFNMWIVTTDATRLINPTGTFPPGHTVEIYHVGGAHTLTFDTTHGSVPISVNVPLNDYGKFVFDGTNWHKLDLHTVT